MKAGKRGHFRAILIPYLRLLNNCKEIVSFKEQRPLDNFKLVFCAISCSLRQILSDATA